MSMPAPLGPQSTGLQTPGAQALWGLHPPALSPALWSPQKYTEEVLSAVDPSQPPPPPLQHFLEQPVERVQQYQALLKVGRPVQGLWGRLVPSHPRPCLDLQSSAGADPQQGAERPELRAAGASLRGGVGPAAASGEPAARVAHGELPRHPGGPGRAHPPGLGLRVQRRALGRGGWTPGWAWLTSADCSPRATSSCGRGRRARGCPGRATIGTSSCSATTWWSASPGGTRAPTPSATSSGT